MTRTALLTLAAAFLCQVQAVAQPSYRVIVHESNPVSELTSEEVSRLFLKKDISWPDGSQVIPVEPGGDKALSAAFATAIHDRTLAALHKYWQQRIFSGEAVPPQQLEGNEDVVTFVRSNPQAIGYVTAQTPLTGVKPVAITIAPRLLSRVEPEYTQLALRAQVEGEVILRVRVNEEGRVTKVEVVQPLPHGLTAEAERVVKRWRYKPAMREGYPVSSVITIKIRFRL